MMTMTAKEETRTQTAHAATAAALEVYARGELYGTGRRDESFVELWGRVQTGGEDDLADGRRSGRPAECEIRAAEEALARSRRRVESSSSLRTWPSPLSTWDRNGDAWGAKRGGVRKVRGDALGVLEAIGAERAERAK